MQVSKWGNSLAIRLPAAVVDVLNLKEGDDIEVCVDDGPRLAIRRKPAAKELLTRLRQYRGSLPADFKFDRLEAHGRGPVDVAGEGA